MPIGTFRHQIRGFAVLQRPRSAAFLRGLLQSYTEDYVISAARHDGSSELGTTN